MGGTLLFALAWYYCPVYGGVHWFRGPISNFVGFPEHRCDETKGDIEVEKVEVDIKTEKSEMGST